MTATGHCGYGEGRAAVICMGMGSVFLQNADKSFDQMDKLIDYINSNLTLNATVRYGTFGSYIQVGNVVQCWFGVATNSLIMLHETYLPYVQLQCHWDWQQCGHVTVPGVPHYNQFTCSHIVLFTSTLTVVWPTSYGDLWFVWLQAINSLNLTWPVYTGDFFPYASGLHVSTGASRCRAFINHLDYNLTVLLLWELHRTRPAWKGWMHNMSYFNNINDSLLTENSPRCPITTETPTINHDFVLRLRL